MDNNYRVESIVKANSMEELLHQIYRQVGMLTKATKDLIDYFNEDGEKPSHDKRLGQMSKAFVAGLANIAARADVVEGTFLGAGLLMEKELVLGEMFVDAVNKVKAEKAEMERRYFEQQAIYSDVKEKVDAVMFDGEDR